MASEASLVQAVYAFRGTNNDELCFKKGDVITVSQREDGGWWEGTLGETTGWFPSNYVKDYRDVSGSATTSPVRAPSEIQAFRNVVLKDIIDSEKAHAAELQGLIANFLLPLEKSDIVTRDEYRQLTGNVFEVLETHEELLALVEECGAKSGPDQRVGGLFLQWAPRMKAVHQKYCASHPRAVCILDKYRDELNSFMERCGAVSPGILVLTAGLSKPFRRLDKYAAMLQELGRHVAESHPDRGDTHRAVAVYKDIASACGATRRQKELELQVVTGAVRGWQGAGGSKDLASLGEVLHMGGVALGETHADRYFVLFPSTLLILSVSRRMSAFVYEGCLPLTGINVSKLEDTEKRKNAFEINGPLIDTITAVCQSKEDAEKWVNLLSQHSSPSRNTTISTSLPHSPTQDEMYHETSRLKFRNPRDSLYHITMPPSTYPPASPYAGLSKYFAKLVRLRVITRGILKSLLYIQTEAKIDLTTVVMRNRHANHMNIRLNKNGSIESDESDSETESESIESHKSNDKMSDSVSITVPKILRQDAVERETSEESNCSINPFGYIRYFNIASKSDIDDDLKDKNISKIDCTHEIFKEINSTSDSQFYEKIDSTCADSSFPKENIDHKIIPKQHFLLNNQYSEGSDNSSFDCDQTKNFMACEDLVNMDESLLIDTMGFKKMYKINLKRQSCPTKFVANKFNDSSLTSVCTPGWQMQNCILPVEQRKYNIDIKNSDNNISNVSILGLGDLNVSENLTLPSIPSNILSTSDSTSSSVSQETVIKMILDPPPMFRNNYNNNDDDTPNLNKYQYENHLLNSDKILRRSKSKDIVQFSSRKSDFKEKSNSKHIDSKLIHVDFKEYDNLQTHGDFQSNSEYHSPRSSDSGVAGSCNLASPEIGNREDSMYSQCETRSLNESACQKILCNDYSMSTGEICKINYMKNKIFADLDAVNFENQCQCTSPFSTPRTSQQTNAILENMKHEDFVEPLNSIDVEETGCLSYFDTSNAEQATFKSASDSVESNLKKLNIHNVTVKNVRHAAINHGWSDPDVRIPNQQKPTTRYHVKLYQCEFDGNEMDIKNTRPSRKKGGNQKPNLQIQGSSVSDHSRNIKNERVSRSKSEDLARKSKNTNHSTGNITYRSDLYAHWWMKAKLPISIVTPDVTNRDAESKQFRTFTRNNES